MHLKRTRGDTIPFTLTIKSNNNGQPVNITGCSFIMTVNSLSVPIDLSTQLYKLDGSIIDVANGLVEFYPTDQNANIVGSFFYDVQITDSYGQVYTATKDRISYSESLIK